MKKELLMNRRSVLKGSALMLGALAAPAIISKKALASSGELNFTGWAGYPGLTEKVFPALAKSSIDQVSLECFHSHVPMDLMALLEGKDVMVGVIDVASDVIVVPLTVQHSAQHGQLLMWCELWKQGAAARPGCILRQQFEIQIIFHGHRNGSFECNFL